MARARVIDSVPDNWNVYHTISLFASLDEAPDPPSRHHLPFDKLTVLSKVEGLMALSKADGLRYASSPALLH